LVTDVSGGLVDVVVLVVVVVVVVVVFAVTGRVDLILK